ncbi:MAG TPA: hypothetical protein VGA75_10195 [Paracoccaceae bacterium]
MFLKLLRRIGRARAMIPDPIDHPDIRAMTLRELADLPFPRPR